MRAEAPRASDRTAFGASPGLQRPRPLDNSDIWPLYSTAFLLEREGRLEEAAEAWHSIGEWCEQHDAQLAAEYPRRQLERARRCLHGRESAT